MIGESDGKRSGKIFASEGGVGKGVGKAGEMVGKHRETIGKGREGIDTIQGSKRLRQRPYIIIYARPQKIALAIFWHICYNRSVGRKWGQPKHIIDTSPKEEREEGERTACMRAIVIQLWEYSQKDFLNYIFQRYEDCI